MTGPGIHAWPYCPYAAALSFQQLLMFLFTVPVVL